MGKEKKKSGQNLTATRDRFDMKRRDFITLLGGGIVMYFGTGKPSELMGMPLMQRREVPEDYNAYFRFDEDGVVHCHVGKIEMGQGPITSLPQQAADELDVSIESINLVMGDTLLCPYDAGTWGSLTTWVFSNVLRAAAAEARGVLLQMGSEYLEIPVKDLQVKNGVISGISNPKKQVSYGELARGKNIEKYLDVKPPVKDHTQFHYVGQSRLKVDSKVKVTGAAQYTGDLKLPGMVYAKIVRPPSHHVKLLSVDYAEAEKIAGVEVVREGDLIAVLHENIEEAEKALSLVRAEYTEDELEVDDNTIFDYLLNAPSDRQVVDSEGDLARGEEEADHVLDSSFLDGYKAHASIEPHTALAHWEGEKVTVWGSCQTPFGAQGDIAREWNLDLEDVRVISPFVGGGFGGKINHPQVLEVVRIAKLADKPVMLAYTREEEFFMDYFRNATVMKIKSGVTASGKITLWDFQQYYAGMRGADTIYHVPNATRTLISANRGTTVHPLAVGAWRAPHANSNTFARESQIDMMAAQIGIDPVQFRLDNLTDEKMINVIRALADKFGYTPAPAPSGRGIGMACGIDAGTWAAVMIEVKVDTATGKVQPLRAVAAQDMGMCVNPQGATLQAESCVTMGMGYALAEDVEFKGGDVITENFDTYQLPLFSWIPESIDTVILDRMDEPPTGGGEPAIICMGGALANAIFDACGARVFRMPMTPERILAAMRT